MRRAAGPARWRRADRTRGRQRCDRPRAGPLRGVGRAGQQRGRRPGRRLRDAGPADFKRIIALDLTAPFECAQAAGRVMLAAGRGVIVNISSLTGHVGLARRAAYTAAKHGLEGLTKALAAEWSPRGVRVLSVAPAYVATELLAGTMAAGGFTEADVAARTPLRAAGRARGGGAGGGVPGLRRRLLHHRVERSGRWRLDRRRWMAIGMSTVSDRQPIDAPLCLLASDGTLAEGHVPALDDAELLAAWRAMLLSRAFDERCFSLQRQGRLGTFSPVHGEEAAVVGSAWALDRDRDWVVPQYRELPAMLHQGYSLTRLPAVLHRRPGGQPHARGRERAAVSDLAGRSAPARRRAWPGACATRARTPS